jgi:hypothetical protein
VGEQAMTAILMLYVIALALMFMFGALADRPPKDNDDHLL